MKRALIGRRSLLPRTVKTTKIQRPEKVDQYFPPRCLWGEGGGEAERSSFSLRLPALRSGVERAAASDSRHHAAVHRERVPGYERRVVGSEKQHRLCDFLRLAHPA